MGRGSRFEVGAHLAWLLDAEGSYRDTARPEWQLVAFEALPGGKPGLGRRAIVSMGDVTDAKGLPRVEVEARSGDEVLVTSSGPLLVQHYGQDRPFAPGTSDIMPYGSVVRAGRLLFAPLFAEHAESVREGRDTLPVVVADPERAAGSVTESGHDSPKSPIGAAAAAAGQGAAAQPRAGDEEGGGAVGRDTLELSRGMYRPRGLVLLTVAALALGFLSGGVVVRTFITLPLHGVTTTGRARPLETQYGGVAYEFELGGQTYSCGPARGVVWDSANGVSITYDPTRPSSCRATQFLSRLALDELFFTALFVGVLIAWAAVLVNFIRHRRGRAA